MSCLRCNAYNRKHLRCGNPAMRNKTKCRHHGGKSTGARTPEGKAKQIEANTIHGNETRAKREERKQTNAELYALEKEMRRLGMVEGSWVNRKPPSR